MTELYAWEDIKTLSSLADQQNVVSLGCLPDFAGAVSDWRGPSESVSPDFRVLQNTPKNVRGLSLILNYEAGIKASAWNFVR